MCDSITYYWTCIITCIIECPYVYEWIIDELWNEIRKHEWINLIQYNAQDRYYWLSLCKIMNSTWNIK